MFCTFFHFKAYKLRFHEPFNGFNCKYSGLIRYSLQFYQYYVYYFYLFWTNVVYTALWHPKKG